MPTRLAFLELAAEAFRTGLLKALEFAIPQLSHCVIVLLDLQYLRCCMLFVTHHSHTSIALKQLVLDAREYTT